MLYASTIQLLRFKFSFFLMPIFWFALSQTDRIATTHAMLMFIVLHVLIYPASNGYNSYMDRDTESIGGIKKPLMPTVQLFYITIVMDVLAVLLAMYVSWFSACCVLAFIGASRAYSYRGIRLKKYPIISFFVTAIFQGGLVYVLVYHSCDSSLPIALPLLPFVASTLLVASFYPLTQIYQHKQDGADGVTTLSMILGYKGTFIFSASLFFLVNICLAVFFYSQLAPTYFFIFAASTIPVLLYFCWWFAKVLKNNGAANFVNTMRMNVIASICTNAGFILILLIEKF